MPDSTALDKKKVLKRSEHESLLCEYALNTHIALSSAKHIFLWVHFISKMGVAFNWRPTLHAAFSVIVTVLLTGLTLPGQQTALYFGASG